MSAVDEIAAYLAHLKTSGNRIDQIIFDELPNGEGMTATDELRRLLDERGVEHMDFNMPERSLTLFAGDEHDGAYTENSVDTILTVYGASPEQAVEATLGSDLKAENAKLWQLVRNVEYYERFGCQGCPHSGSCGAGTLYDEDCAMSLEIEREKRELGIEADA